MLQLFIISGNFAGDIFLRVTQVRFIFTYITVSLRFVKYRLVYLLTTKYSIEKTLVLWCNANVLRLYAPLVSVFFILSGGFRRNLFGE